MFVEVLCDLGWNVLNVNAGLILVGVFSVQGCKVSFN